MYSNSPICKEGAFKEGYGIGVNLRIANICRQVLPVVGLTALWLSVFNRLQYPARHTFYHLDDTMGGFVQAVYCIAFILAALAFVFAREQVEGALAQNSALVAAFGAIGCIGVFLPMSVADGTGLAVAAVVVGALLVAAYISVHFTYWALRASGVSLSYIGISAALSLGCYFLIDLMLTLTGARGIAVPLVCPLVSACAVLLLAAVDRKANALATNVEAGAAEADSPGEDAAVTTVVTPVIAAQQASPSVDEAVANLQQALDPVIAALAQEYDLSKREAELAALAYGNFSARKIAQELFIAESTVYTHLKRIYRKTGVHSKRELIELIDARK